MTIRIKKEKTAKNIIHAVEELASVDLSECYQCKKCTCGCPVSGHTESPPSEIIRRLQLGAADEILNSDIIWTCSSCETCFARCPMGIDMAAVMDALRILAVERRAVTPKGDIPLFNRAFLKTVSKFGRTYDLGMIAAYKIRTSTIMKDMDKLPAMLKKRKIAILPPRGADKKTVKRIFDSVSHKKGIRK
jgi:heterodisulfide reductase subunit C